MSDRIDSEPELELGESQARPQPGPALTPRAPYRPPAALPPRRSSLMPLFLLLLLGVGAYGGYYGYGRYQLSTAIHGFDQEAAEQLRNWLLQRGRSIGGDDLRQFALELAPRHGLTLEPGDLQVSVEPYSESSARKLSVVAQAAIAMGKKITRDGGPALWVVGFRAQLKGRSGVTRGSFESQHYTWFEWVKP